MNLFRKIKNRQSRPGKPLGRSQSSRTRPAEYQPLEPRCLMAGDFVWADQFGGAASESGQAVAADGSGNVYTVGSFSGTVDFDPGPAVLNITASGPQDGFVTKLNSAGALVWVRTFGGTGNISPNALELDYAGALLITGSFTGTADFDPGPGTRNFTATGGSLNGFLSKIDFDGGLIWTRQLGGTGAGVTLGQDAAVFVTGSFTGTRDFNPGPGIARMSAIGEDGYILKLDGGGNYIWAREFNGANSTARCLVRDVVIDEAGNVLSTGQFQGAFDFDPGTRTTNLSTPTLFSDAFVSKLDAAGNFVWVKQLSGPGTQTGMQIELDYLGQPVIAGDFSGTADFNPDSGRLDLTATLDDIFVWKLTGDGGLIWARQIGGSNYESVSDLTLDSQGSLYLAGRFGGTTDFNPSTAVSSLTSAGLADGYILKLDAGANYLWARQIGGSEWDEVTGIALDSRFNILATGNFRGTVDMNPRSGLYEFTSSRYANDAFTLKLTQSIVYRTLPLANELTLRRSGVQLQIVNDATGFVLASRPAAHYLGAEFRGSNGLNDRLTLDFGFGGPMNLPGGVTFNGGIGGVDTIRLIGSGAEEVMFSTGQAADRATYNVSTGSSIHTDITANNVEAAGLSRVSRLDYFTRGSDDLLTASPVAGDLAAAAVRISGSSGLVNTVPLVWNEIPRVEIDLSAFDLDAAPNDSLVFLTGGFSAAGLRDLSVLTGPGDDQLSVNDVNLQLPVPGGEFLFQAGSGFDKLSATADTDLELDSLQLRSGFAGRILHQDIEYAELVGGAGDNKLVATAFHGMVSLYGNEGNDILYGTANSDDLFGGAGKDFLFGGLGDDWLDGGSGRDSFYFEGTETKDELRLVVAFDSLGMFQRSAIGSEPMLERDYFEYDIEDTVEIRAGGGDDLINVDLAFAIFGTVDGGEGTDLCDSPVDWTRISC